MVNSFQQKFEDSAYHKPDRSIRQAGYLNFSAEDNYFSLGAAQLV